jgi:DNA-binding transcriptional LysR family regulator
MDITQLNYFIAVAKYKSFSLVSKEFYVSQPCISHRIKELEKELDTKLFNRNTRSVELTTAGEIFLEDAKKAVSILEKSKEKILQSDKKMNLDISFLAAATRNFLPQIIRLFKKKHPNIDIHLYRSNAQKIHETGSKHRYDIYFSLTSDLASLSHLSTKIIHTDHYCLVTTKNHPAVARMPVDYDALKNEPFVIFKPQDSHILYEQTMEICNQLGFSPHIVETYDLYEDLLYAIEAGIGISVLPYQTKNYFVNDLTYTLLDISNISIDLSMGWEKEITNPAVPLFLDLFRKFMNDHPDVFE